MALRETLNRISGMTEPPPNEQETITHIIEPILRDLGWDVSNDRGNREVRPQHPVGGSKKIKMDIALMKDDRCVCVVEAKKPSVKLTGDPEDQVLMYAFHGGVTYCVLTNGLEWRFYLPFEVKPEEREFAVLNLKDNPIGESENDLKRFLSRVAVLNGDAERDAVGQRKQRQIDRELPDIWRRMLTEPDQELVTWVEKRISDKHGFSPSAGQVAKIIVATTHYNLLDHKFNHQVQDTRHQAAAVVREVDKRPIGYTLFGDYKPWRSGIGMWADVVKEVYYRHENNFLEKSQQLRLSKSILFLRNGLLISHDRDKINRPRGPIKPRGTSVPVYIERSLKVDVCIELAYELLKIFGHPASDLQIHEE